MLAGVFFTSLAALTVLTKDHGPAELGPVDFVGIGGWVLGFVFEVVADYQKERWRGRPENKEKRRGHVSPHRDPDGL